MGKILEKTFNVNDAARILRVSPTTVRRKMARHKISFYNFDGKVEIGESHLRDYVSRSEVRAATENLRGNFVNERTEQKI